MSVAEVARAQLGARRIAARRPLWILDLAIAAALTVGGLFEVANLTYSAPRAVAVTACVMCTGSMAFRRPAPFATAVVITTAGVIYQVATNDPDGSFIVPAFLLAYYSLGRAAAERRAWRRLAVLLAYALAGDAVIDAANERFSLLEAIATWPLAVLPAIAGVIVARHACLARQLAEATSRLRDEQQVRADRLLGEERNRVARELHDVVAHHVSVMVIQAGGARLVASTDSAAAEAALQVVERSGRAALADLRRIMGVMRRGDGSNADPSVGLAHLDQLVERARLSGVPVRVTISGRLDQVPSAVDLVAYRVVQEALTNVVKHARTATASLVISVSPAVIDVRVSDSGERSSAPVLPGSRHGLIGMRERVALYGGQLRSGQLPGGGFEVHASIPMRAEPLAHSGISEPVPLGANVAAAARWRDAIRARSTLLLAAGWFVALEIDALTDHYRRGPVAMNLIAVAVLAIGFRWHRRSPLLFLLVAGIGAITLNSGLTSPHATLVGFYCVTVPIFAVAAWQTRPWAIAGLALWVAGSGCVGFVEHEPVAGVVGGLIMSCLLWAAGRLWRARRLLAERLRQTHQLLAAERDDHDRLAIAGERSRIARELHTVVAHGVVAMIVQAAAARQIVRSDPEAAVTAMSAIERTGREALARMRDILGVLRARQDSLLVEPQPGIGQLHAMIQRLRERGRSVELRIEGDPAPLPAGVDLTAYRIVEATLAEADPRPSREVSVVLRFAEDHVEVEVGGSGLQLPARLALTVRERAALCDGAVLAPADTDGARRLLVQLPFTIAEVAPV